MISIKERFGRADSATEQPPATNGNGAGGNGHRDLDLRELRPPRTTADRLRPVGRVALWLVLGIIFARGIAQIVNPDEPVVGDTAAGVEWPDAATDAFALDFARTYLSFSGEGNPEKLTLEHNATVEQFFTPELRADIAAQAMLPGGGVQQLYYSGEVIGAEPVDPDHALLTVEALIQQDVPRSKDRPAFAGQKRIFLGVPVGRDEAGRLALYAHPSLVAEAPTGKPTMLDATDVGEPGATEISDVVERFLGAYLSGAETGDLRLYLLPGAQLPPLDGGYRLLDLQSVEQFGEDLDDETTRSLIVTADVRDQTTGVIYTWQYLLDVEQRDRWYIASIEGGPGEVAAPAPAPAAEDSSAEAEDGSTTASTN